jgi:hypothetical protein
MHASQPVQLSARMTANSFGSFFLAFPAPLAMMNLYCFHCVLLMIFS